MKRKRKTTRCFSSGQCQCESGNDPTDFESGLRHVRDCCSGCGGEELSARCSDWGQRASSRSGCARGGCVVVRVGDTCYSGLESASQGRRLGRHGGWQQEATECRRSRKEQRAPWWNVTGSTLQSAVDNGPAANFPCRATLQAHARGVTGVGDDRGLAAAAGATAENMGGPGGKGRLPALVGIIMKLLARPVIAGTSYTAHYRLLTATLPQYSSTVVAVHGRRHMLLSVCHFVFLTSPRPVP